MKLSLPGKILSCLILGIVLGLLFSEATLFINSMSTLGSLFIKLCKMAVVPLVFVSLVVGVASLGEVKKLGLLGLLTLSYNLLTSVLAVTLGLVLANLVDPGGGLTLPVGANYPGQAAVPLAQVLVEIIPANPFQALVEGNILQIMVLAVLVGRGITLAGEKAQPVHQFFVSLAELMSKINNGLIKLAPLGVLALLVPVVAYYRATTLLPILAVIITVCVACFIHAIFVYSLAVRTLAGMSPSHFFRGLFPAMLVAFSTSSSFVSLPVTMKIAEEKLGVSKEVSSFVLPLGATINNDGIMIYQGVCAVFVAQVFGLELTFSQQLTVIMTATLASLGTAGVPGAGLIMLTLVLQSVGLPLEGMALLAGTEVLLDMLKAMLNVTGNASAAVVVEAGLANRFQKIFKDINSSDKSAQGCP